MRRHPLRIALALLLLAGAGIGWYLFRPELLFIDSAVSEPPPAAGEQPLTLRRGQFHGVEHAGQGVATVLGMPDGSTVLRFTEFDVSNGPDVYVYLVALDDAHDSASVGSAEFISLGPLKGNVGDQNYQLPAGVDLDKYRAVSIWCKRFSANFAVAPLKPVLSSGF